MQVNAVRGSARSRLDCWRGTVSQPGSVAVDEFDYNMTFESSDKFVIEVRSRRPYVENRASRKRHFSTLLDLWTLETGAEKNRSAQTTPF